MNHHLGESDGSHSLDLLERKNGRPLYSWYRLQYDLARLAEDMPRGIRVVTDEADMSRLCLILEPQEGFLEGCRIHLSVNIPTNWPCVPLSAKIDTPFSHPNVFDGYVCCDALHCPGFIPPNRALPILTISFMSLTLRSEESGYSPAYSLGGTFIQILSLFSRSSFDAAKDHNMDSAFKARDIFNQAGDHFDCDLCKWKSLPSSLNPRSEMELGQSKHWIHFLDALDNKSLFVLISHLDTPSLLNFGSVYKRVKKLALENNEIAAREIRCFVTRRDYRDAILGIGLRLDTDCTFFESSFEYISKFAFDELFIRKDTANQLMELWLPLAVDGSHYAKASSDVRRCLAILESETNDKLDAAPYQKRLGIVQDPIRHVIAMANTVVSIFKKACDEDAGMSTPQSLLGAAERAIAGYCSFIHLITSYAVENPEVVSAALETVSSFIAPIPKREIGDGRHRSIIPDLGRFMVLLSLVDEHSWSDVRASVLREMFVRLVRFKAFALPGLLYLEEDAVCEWRLTKTFNACREELRLFLLQVFFMEKMSKREGMRLLEARDDLNRRLGLAPPGLAAELLGRVQTIYKMDSLETFAKEAGWETTTREGLTTFLRACVVESGKVGYHHTHSMTFTVYRARDDPDFREKLIASGRNVVSIAADACPRLSPSSGWEFGYKMSGGSRRRKRARDTNNKPSASGGKSDDNSDATKRSRL